MDQTVSDKILKLEEKMSFLATAVSVSPLLGLFGTVWGVMMAFIAMAVGGKADIANMAPGISGALITTVAGLVVAIPSSIGYNYLTKYIKQIVVFMDSFVEDYVSRLRIEHN
jgi:biopolymer transport protein TolQ